MRIMRRKFHRGNWITRDEKVIVFVLSAYFVNNVLNVRLAMRQRSDMHATHIRNDDKVTLM